MHIRPAKLSDVPVIAKIGTEAFATEPIYAHFFPRRSQYPDDYCKFFVNEARRMLASPGHLIVVAETDQEDERCEGERSISATAEGQVIAYATFIRSGSAAERALWNADSLTKIKLPTPKTFTSPVPNQAKPRTKVCIATELQRFLIFLHGLGAAAFAPNRAVDLPVIRDYYSQAAAIHAGQLRSSRSKLDFKTLAVDPAFQRRGYGEKLVEWCGMRASQEDISVFGDASTRGLPLYLRNGCVEIGRIVLPEKVVEQSDKGDLVILERLEVIVLKWNA